MNVIHIESSYTCTIIHSLSIYPLSRRSAIQISQLLRNVRCLIVAQATNQTLCIMYTIWGDAFQPVRYDTSLQSTNGIFSLCLALPHTIPIYAHHHRHIINLNDELKGGNTTISKFKNNSNEWIQLNQSESIDLSQPISNYPITNNGSFFSVFDFEPSRPFFAISHKF